MIWYKTWLETRWRFFIGLVVLMIIAAILVFGHSSFVALLSQIRKPFLLPASQWDRLLEVNSTYRGYIWSQWFARNAIPVWSVFAVLLGVGGIMIESSRGTALFTLSLPVTRRALLGVWTTLGFIELVALAAVSTSTIVILSSLIGESYAVKDALIHTTLEVSGGVVIFSFSILLTTIFNEQRKPILIALTLPYILNLLAWLTTGHRPFAIIRIMSGWDYFHQGVIPWTGLAVCLGVSVVFFYLSLRLLEQRDF